MFSCTLGKVKVVSQFYGDSESKSVDLSWTQISKSHIGSLIETQKSEPVNLKQTSLFRSDSEK